MQLTHAVLPGMLARGRGGILNVASTIAFQPGPYQATYGASKAFVLSFSQAVRAETKGSGVTVTALCPGATRTGFVDALGADVSGVAVYQNLASPEPVVAAGLRGLDRGRACRDPGSPKLVDDQHRPLFARIDLDRRERTDAASRRIGGLSDRCA